MIAAQHIKDLRLQNNYSQSYTAEKIKVSQKTYSNMECGKSKITLTHLKKLSEIYKMSLVEFIKLVIQADAKTINAIKKENPSISSSELLDGNNLSIHYIDQLKARIKDLQLLVKSKDHKIQLLTDEVDRLEKQTL